MVMSVWNVAGALQSPIAITFYSNCPYFVVYAVFRYGLYGSGFGESLCLHRSWKKRALPGLSNNSSARGTAVLFFFEILFSPLKPTAAISDPSFSFAKNMGEPYGDLLGRILPDARFFVMYSLAATSSAGDS